MTEQTRWIIDVVVAIVGIIVGYFVKTIQIKKTNKKITKDSIEVKGNDNTVAGRDINNGKNI